jgi:hypothetical protein
VSARPSPLSTLWRLGLSPDRRIAMFRVDRGRWSFLLPLLGLLGCGEDASNKTGNATPTPLWQCGLVKPSSGFSETELCECADTNQVPLQQDAQPALAAPVCPSVDQVCCALQPALTHSDPNEPLGHCECGNAASVALLGGCAAFVANDQGGVQVSQCPPPPATGN